MPEIISKLDAKAAGLTRYFTGVPCSKGHVAERLVSNRNCCKCTREAENRRRRGEALPTIERICKSDKCNNSFEIPIGNHQVYCSGKCRSYYIAKLQRLKNPELHRKYNRSCYNKNAGEYNFKRAGKRELKKTLLTEEEFKKGIEIYNQMMAMNRVCGKRIYCVDHIIPLSKGGRHHPNNFQIITIAENSLKRENIRLKDLIYIPNKLKNNTWIRKLGIRKEKVLIP